MKKIVAILALAAASFSKFTPELTSKYSIEVLNEGTEGTQPKVGDEVHMHDDGKLKDGT